jgi:hypothetical protein
MSTRQVLQGKIKICTIKHTRESEYDFNSVYFLMFIVFEQYQKSRTTFVQTVADLASRPQNIETLQNAGRVDSNTNNCSCKQSGIIGQIDAYI